MEKTRKPFQHPLFLRLAVTVLVVFFGALAVIGAICRLQQTHSENRVAETATGALDSVVALMESNAEQVYDLCGRYHTDNQAVLEDMTMLLRSDAYNQRLKGTAEERTEVMRSLSRVLGEGGDLFIADKKGRITLASDPALIGTDLGASLTENELALLMRNSDDTGVSYRGTLRTITLANGDRTEVYDAVATCPPGSKEPSYFYSCPFGNDSTLVYTMSISILNDQLSALSDISKILSGIVVGDDGFLIVTDAGTGDILWFGSDPSLAGVPFESTGLSPKLLEDGFSGEQIIAGAEYRCMTRAYNTDFYGELAVTVACPAKTVFAENRTVILFTSVAFAVCAALILLYAILLSLDPEHITGYDDNVCTLREAWHRHRKRTGSIAARNIRVTRRNGKTFYIKLGIAEKLSSAIVLSLLLVFVVAWNAQTLSAFSTGNTRARTAVRQMNVLLENRNTGTGAVMERYSTQYLSKLKLIRFILEEDPVLIKTLNTDDPEILRTYIGEDLEPITDKYGRPVRSIPNAEQLQALAESNMFDFLSVYDDHGRTIAAADDSWYFTLSRDPLDQSSEFFDIILGRKDDYVQEPRLNDVGLYYQYIGTPFHYYTLEGEGSSHGTFVSAKEFETFKKNGYVLYKGEQYTVKKHRSLLEGGISDNTLALIMQSTATDSLLGRVNAGEDGFLLIFDNTAEHNCIYSPDPAQVGKPAADLRIPENAFLGNFRGTIGTNSGRCYMTVVFNEDRWVAVMQPTDTLMRGRDAIAFMITAIALAFYAVLMLLCIFSGEEEEDFIRKIVDRRLTRSQDNGMVRVTMPNGKTKYVRSATARFSDRRISWSAMTTNQKLAAVLKVLLSCCVALLLVCIIFCDRIFGPDSMIPFIIRGDWDRNFNYFSVTAFTGMVLCISVSAFVATKFLVFIIRNMGSRVETFGRLVLSLIKYGAVLFTMFYGLSLIGFSTSGIITSAGIISVVVGLGAQKLVGDILSGIFIVFEGSFRVGDIVTIDDYRGIVVDIGLRTTKIENLRKSPTGDIKIYNNSSIATIVNMTKKASKARAWMCIGFGEDLLAAEDVLKKALPEIAQKNPMIIGIPYYDGVTKVGDSSILLGISALCAEKDRISVEYYLNREILLLCNKNGIEIPFNQLTLTYGKDAEPKTDPVSPETGE
ncbi:MAG: mechanosensitive ion channel family protein [Clostridia bacterium]|nr:mechanosensitive ion channel family protein [Clostridia bacterium]